MHIFGKGNSATLLAMQLQATKSTRKVPRYYRNKGLIINWGYTCGRGLNCNIIGNKMREFKILHSAELTPKMWENCPYEESEYPILGRKISHSKGNDIIFIPSPIGDNAYSDFYVKYIDKKAEFRAHILGDTVAIITKKKRIDDRSDKIIWSFDRGYRQCTYLQGKKYWDIVANIAIKAIKAVNYDFGAVDVVIDKSNKAYVLEINSAPGLLVDNRIELYAQYFKSLER